MEPGEWESVDGLEAGFCWVLSEEGYRQLKDTLVLLQEKGDSFLLLFGNEPKLTIFVLATLGAIYWAGWLAKVIWLSYWQKPVCPYNFNKELAREFIKHEDTLVDHRVTWLLTSQALLFTALGFLLSDGKEFAGDKDKIIVTISFIGIVIAIASITILFAASCAVIKNSPKYKTCWSCKRGISDNGEEVVGYRVNILMEFFTPSSLLPIMFIFAWYVVAQVTIS